VAEVNRASRFEGVPALFGLYLEGVGGTGGVLGVGRGEKDTVWTENDLRISYLRMS
jgi:hypothetical protein